MRQVRGWLLPSASSSIKGRTVWETTVASVAILIANAHYTREADLECCLADLEAMHELVKAVGRHSVVRVASDIDADGMRDMLREALSGDASYEEVLFYFSGHGALLPDGLFYCGTSFEASRANETGLSQSDLIAMVRAVRPEVFVNVIDACSAGAPLLKARQPMPPMPDGAFASVYQFASCRQDQVSLGGEPLSLFTRAFLDACLRKASGPVYYNDVANTLRDDFIENDDQTPQFVQQGSGRECLVDDVTTLRDFRAHYAERWPDPDAEEGDLVCEEGDRAGTDILVTEPGVPMTPIEVIKAAEARLVSPEAAGSFVATLFDGVIARFSSGEFGDAFDVTTKAHSRFTDPGSRDFITRTLARQTRHDALVTAEVRHEARKRPRTLWEEAAGMGLLSSSRMETVEVVELELNCRMERAQIEVVLTPRYRMLERLVLVLTCAPSLERCFVFERLTRHRRSDWEDFESGGREVTKRWYEMAWDDNLAVLVEKVASNVEEQARAHVDAVAKRLLGT
jgi:hypothetical protein